MTIAPPTKAFGAPFEPLSIDETALAREYAPNAFGGFFADEMRPKPYTIALQADVAIVTVEGPLDTRAGWWCDGYDEIVARCAMALADPKVKALVLALDSPGGMAAGNLDAARQLRAHADACGKPMVAHAGTMACSAAYALAVAADHLCLTSDGTVGSIGTLATVYDRTKANEQEGYDVRVVRSGSLKADPHPDVPLTDASVARVRARINELAGMFSAWVAERRPAMGDPLTLQGASVYGADAVTKGLADQVGTLADAISTAAALAADTTTRRKNPMPGMAALSGALDVRSMDTTITDDRSFIDAMIPHHEAALAMVADADGKLKNADLKKIAAGIKTTQTAEIATMKTIRDSLPPKKNAAAMAADSATRRKTIMEDNKASATLATLRTSAGVTTDEELVATLATIKHAAGQLPGVQRELAELRAQITARDAADAAKARAAVFDKHRERGALTPAMEKDEACMADFAPLSAEALDRVLSRIPGVAAPVTPRTPAALTPARAAAAPVGEREREFAAATGVPLDAITQVAERDAASKES